MEWGPSEKEGFRISPNIMDRRESSPEQLYFLSNRSVWHHGDKLRRDRSGL
jgi:hypothetical protein